MRESVDELNVTIVIAGPLLRDTSVCQLDIGDFLPSLSQYTVEEVGDFMNRDGSVWQLESFRYGNTVTS